MFAKLFDKGLDLKNGMNFRYAKAWGMGVEIKTRTSLEGLGGWHSLLNNEKYVYTKSCQGYMLDSEPKKMCGGNKICLPKLSVYPLTAG